MPSSIISLAGDPEAQSKKQAEYDHRKKRYIDDLEAHNTERRKLHEKIQYLNNEIVEVDKEMKYQETIGKTIRIQVTELMDQMSFLQVRIKNFNEKTQFEK